jgi:hypothetical protein
MKFHHNQKVNIRSGYYKSYKGRVTSHRLNKTNKSEYLVRIRFKDSEDFIDEWISEDSLRASWF